jgi:hypothetical protein
VIVDQNSVGRRLRGASMQRTYALYRPRRLAGRHERIWFTGVVTPGMFPASAACTYSQDYLDVTGLRPLAEPCGTDGHRMNVVTKSARQPRRWRGDYGCLMGMAMQQPTTRRGHRTRGRAGAVAKVQGPHGPPPDEAELESSFPPVAGRHAMRHDPVPGTSGNSGPGGRKTARPQVIRTTEPRAARVRSLSETLRSFIRLCAFGDPRSGSLKEGNWKFL